MASTEAAAAAISVTDIAAWSDAELAQFMTKHRRPDGSYGLPVDGWDKLSKDERARLAERLQAQQRGLAEDPAAQSRPLDLDDLDARLHQVTPGQSRFQQSESGSTDESRASTVPPDEIGLETESYHKLVGQGGRPLYTLDLLQELLRDPHSYAEMLRPWQVNISPVSASGILDKQLHRWTDFRKWQTDHRGLVEDDGGFPAYVEEEKQAVQRCLRPKAAAKRLAEIEADPACLKQSWEDQKWRRERQLRHVRERGCKGFPDYVQAVKSRLARHDFTQPFELDEKPEKQDKLTTWIEYLNYEYWWLDKHRSDIQRHEPRRDELWRDLVSKNVLRPYETEEYLRTDASPLEREAEKDQARQAVERAEAEGLRVHALTQKDPNRLTIPKATRVSMLKQATAAVIAAKQRLEQVEARSEPITQFIRGTFGYTGAKREAWRQGLLVQWVRDQVPLIEKEMGLSKSSRSGSGRTRTTPKRRRDADQEGSSEKRDSKQARVSSARKTRSKATEPQPVPDVAPQSKASRRSQPDDPANGHADKHRDTPKPPAPRRSARIAARQKAGCQDDDGQDAGHAPRTRSRPRRGATEQSSKTQPAPKKSKTEKPAKKADKLKKTATQQSTDTSEPARRSRRRR